MLKNGFLTFCCAFIPGAGQMYQGYMKRGLSLILTACLIGMVGSLLNPVLLLLVVLWMYSFFDTLGVCLIAAGTLFLLARFLPGLPWLVIWQVLPAAGLILLGCEVLYYSARPGACRCDFGSVVLCLLMMGGCFGVSTLMLLAQMLGRGFTIHL